eukprot:COSAG06_NODE_2858_length_6166_cov_5.402011_5_plen_67_part_00
MLVLSLSWHKSIRFVRKKTQKRRLSIACLQTKIMERHEGKPIAHLKVSLAHKHTGASKALCCIAFQ